MGQWARSENRRFSAFLPRFRGPEPVLARNCPAPTAGKNIPTAENRAKYARALHALCAPQGALTAIACARRARYRARLKARSPLKITSRLAPMSAATASHRLVSPAGSGR